MITRRQMLMRSALGLGAVATTPTHAWCGGSISKPGHFRPRAKQVLFLFQTGGVSHVDSFDPKPRLQLDDGKPTPGKPWNFLLGSPWKSRPRGQSGVEISDLFPALGDRVDDLCLLRSLTTPHGDHFQATLHMHSGSNGAALPGIGAWVNYALGSANRDLPGHVVFAAAEPYGGAQSWGANFLPARFQGVRFTPTAEPLPNLDRGDISRDSQRAELDLIAALNREHAATRLQPDDLDARSDSFETAFRMQDAAPEIFRLDDESDATLDLYGIQRGGKRGYGWQCLMARRLLERDVRFVEIFHRGSSNNWDQHTDIRGHASTAKEIDTATAGMLIDMRQRGMLDDVLVVWGTEFGRTPWKDGTLGRGHYRTAFSGWLAGAGVKRGHVHGATDEHGLQVTEGKVTVHDLHATILHLLGIDHTRLTYHFAGRDYRLTDVYGDVIDGVLA